MYSLYRLWIKDAPAQRTEDINGIAGEHTRHGGGRRPIDRKQNRDFTSIRVHRVDRKRLTQDCGTCICGNSDEMPWAGMRGQMGTLHGQHKVPWRRKWCNRDNLRSFLFNHSKVYPDANKPE